MVHPSALPDASERTRHERFILTRLALGAAALGLAPAYLAWRGTLGPLEALLLLALALPLLAAVILSRSGRLGIAHGISATALALVIVALAGMTGGATSPLLLWLALLPVEALFFGARAYVLRAGGIAAAGLVGLVLAHELQASPAPAPAHWIVAEMPWLGALAILHAMLVASGILSRSTGEQRGRRAADARAQLLLDHVGDLVTWHDATGSVVFANAAARSLAGAAPDDLLGRGLLDRVHVADRPLFLKALSDAVHAGGRSTACFRTVFVPADGGTRPAQPIALWLEMQACRVPAADASDGIAVVCVMRDVTARRALEEERAQGHAAAVKASDVKDQFLATVSHELRTPLNAIIGFSEMLGGAGGTPLCAEKREEYAGIIRASGLHLLDVVNTLLDVSKIESGAMTIEQEPLDLAEIARGCCSLMALRAETNGIALEQVIGPDLPVVQGDRRALKQIAINLLSNAVKFTPAGGRVTLAVVRDGEMIDLSVSDTGIGIAETDLPRLGDPFFQAKGSLDRAYEGTGLGLSVVRGLVGLHGGWLTVESAPGSGTRVSVRLPVAGVAEAPRPAKIATFARAPRRGLESKIPFRLTA